MRKVMVLVLVLLVGGMAFAGDGVVGDEEKAEKKSYEGAMMVWYEIGSPNVDAARKFYKKLFGFELAAMEGPDAYYLFNHKGEDVGGLTQAEAPYLTIYFAVDNITAALEKAVELGATVMMEETPIDSTASFGMFKDPDGNIVGLWAATGEESDEMMEEAVEE